MPIDQRTTRRVAILGGARIPFCRQHTSYSNESLLDLLTASMKAIVQKYKLEGKRLDEVALGAVFYHPSIWNTAREAVLASGLSPETPAIGTDRACATSLETTLAIANKIALGQSEVGIGGGADSMSNPAIFYRPSLARSLVRTVQAKSVAGRIAAWRGMKLSDLKPGTPMAEERTTGLLMGEHCEKMVKEWKISRQDQDELSLASHQNAWKAYERGFYNDLVFPHAGAQRDNNVRADTSLEKLSKLKPSFDRTGSGTLTAGNSSPLTDGSAAVLLSSEAWAREHNHEVLAYLTAYQVAAVDIQKEGLLMAPAYAVGRMLQKENLKLQEFDLYEIHEAFAGQVLCTLKAWESDDFCKEKIKLPRALGKIDRSKLNTAGGSVALGHPFGATGARIVASLAKLLKEKGSGRALISICTGGGMGTVAILERP